MHDMQNDMNITLWLSSKRDSTSGHIISQKYTRVQHKYRNWESGLAKACYTQAYLEHAAHHVEWHEQIETLKPS